LTYCVMKLKFLSWFFKKSSTRFKKEKVSTSSNVYVDR
jgi:hypothetical protein